MNKIITLAILVLASCCAQKSTDAAKPGSRPTLKDYDNAPAAGPLFMPFR